MIHDPNVCFLISWFIIFLMIYTYKFKNQPIKTLRDIQKCDRQRTVTVFLCAYWVIVWFILMTTIVYFQSIYSKLVSLLRELTLISFWLRRQKLTDVRYHITIRDLSTIMAWGWEGRLEMGEGRNILENMGEPPNFWWFTGGQWKVFGIFTSKMQKSILWHDHVEWKSKQFSMTFFGKFHFLWQNPFYNVLMVILFTWWYLPWL